MKLNNLYKTAGYAVTLLVCVWVLSCTLDPYLIPQEELYTRNFIKKFGLIDPEQDWNMAKQAVVNVKLGDTNIPKVKIYGKQGSKYYLIADLDDVSGELAVPVDIPKSCKEILVKANGRKYYGTIDRPIDCSSMSRGVPDVTYSHNSSGDYTNPNTAVYEKSKTVGSKTYAVKVQHTVRGNGAELGFTDNGEYKYFNTQQMAPVVSPEKWDRYYSLNKLIWFDNPVSDESSKQSWGILPERGVFNVPASNLTDWLTAKRREGNEIVEDFTIETGSDGSLTLFPYYYGTNLQHELGVYLIDENDNPILANGNTYEEDNAANYKLDDFVSFPVFQNRQHGDLQIKHQFDDRIKGIRLKDNATTINLVVGNTTDIGDLVQVNLKENDSDNWVDYNTYIAANAATSHSRLAVHVWDNEKTGNGWVEFKNYHTLTTLKTGSAYGVIGIATGMANTESGKGKTIGYIANVNYEFNEEDEPEPTVEYVLTSDIPDTVELVVGETATYNITSLKISDQDQDVWDSTDYIKVADNWYPDYMDLTLDKEKRTLTITAKKVCAASDWCNPIIYIDNNNNGYWDDGDTELKKFLVVITEASTSTTTVQHSYSETYNAWPLSSPTWESYFYDTNASVSEITLWTGEESRNYSNSFSISQNDFSGATEDHNLFIAISFWSNGSSATECYITITGTWGNDVNTLPDVTSPQTIDSETSSLTIPLTSNLVTKLKEQGFKITPPTELYGFTVTSVKLVPKNPTAGTGDPVWAWNSDGRSSAASALATYYSNPANYPSGRVSCASHSDEQISFTGENISVGTPTVTIADNADYSTKSYTVTWPVTETVEQSSGAPRHKTPSRRLNKSYSRMYTAPAPRRAASRDVEAGRPVMLQDDIADEWSDVNSYWTPVLPMYQEVASYPPNMTMLGRSRGYDFTIKVDGQPYDGKVGMYMKVLGDNHIAQSDDAKWDEISHDNSGYYSGLEHGSTGSVNYNDVTFPYVVFSQKRFNKDANGDASDQIASLVFKHPNTDNTYMTFEDMLLTNSSYQKVGKRESSDRDVNDLIFYITNYKSVGNDKSQMTEEVEYEEGFPWIWAVEDLGATDDFDFNDLVVKITSITTTKKITDTESGSSTERYEVLSKEVTFTPLAAGGTLPLFIHLVNGDDDYVLYPGKTFNITGKADFKVEGVTFADNGLLRPDESDAQEIHKWFGNGTFATTEMINTGRGPSNQEAVSCKLYVKAPTCDESTGKLNNDGFQINIFSDGKTIENANAQSKKVHFYVTVDHNKLSESNINHERLSIENRSLGKAPQSFIIKADNWEWPTERQNIIDKYPDFGKWITDSKYEWIH